MGEKFNRTLTLEYPQEHTFMNFLSNIAARDPLKRCDGIYSRPFVNPYTAGGDITRVIFSPVTVVTENNYLGEQNCASSTKSEEYGLSYRDLARRF
jgi:hypothetical protein